MLPRRPVGLGLAVVLALGACSPAPVASRPGDPTEALPSASAVASPSGTMDLPATSAPTSALASNAPTSTPAPTDGPPTTAPAGWRIVAPPLKVPAAYLDFGFAANGDLLAIGTDNIVDRPLTAWIARYSADGTLQKKVTVEKKLIIRGGDWIDVDRTSDSVLFQQVDSGLTTSHLFRAASGTGKTTASIDLQDDVIGVALGENGRIYGISPYATAAKGIRTCVVERLTAGGGIDLGVDWYGGTCGTRDTDTGKPPYGDPRHVELGRDNRLWLVDEAPADERLHDASAGPGLTVLDLSLQLVSHVHLSIDYEFQSPRYTIWIGQLVIAGAKGGDLYLGETRVSEDATRSTGYRVRHFDPEGRVVETLGDSGTQDGVTWPSMPNIDGDGRLWVIDLDLASKSYSIKVRE